MFIPLHDTNPLVHVRFQWMTIAIIIVTSLIFVLFQSGLPMVTDKAIVLSYGMIPAVVNDVRELSPHLVRIPEEMSYLSYAFLHGGWMHLIGNMLFIWVFGDNVEDALGHIKFLIFYLACAAAGAWTHALMAPNSTAPLIGASGAAAGIVGAYLMLHPHVRVWVLALGRIPLPLPAFLVLGAWGAFQVFNALTDTQGNVSWWTHIGGMLAGCLLVVIMRRKGVPLFDKA